MKSILSTTRTLRTRGVASAAADISDGLAADLGHIADASGVAATIEAESVPLSAMAQAAVVAGDVRLETLLTGGDDYELVFCVPPEKSETVRQIVDAIDLPLTAIGRITKGSGVTVRGSGGAPIPLSKLGYTHG